MSEMDASKPEEQPASPMHYEVKGEIAHQVDMHRAKAEDAQAVYKVLDAYSSIEIVANAEGFAFLASQLQDMVKAEVGADAWLSTVAGHVGMGPPVLILRKV